MLLTGSEAAAVAAACDVELPQFQRWLAAAGGNGEALQADALRRVSDWLGSQASALAPQGTSPPSWELSQVPAQLI